MAEQRSILEDYRAQALSEVRAWFRMHGIAGPTVMRAEQVIAALDEAGLLRPSTTDSGAVDVLRELIAVGSPLPQRTDRWAAAVERARAFTDSGGQ